MNRKTILQVTDPRLSPYRCVKDRQLAQAHGLFVVEGEHLVRRLLASTYEPHSVLMTEARWGRGDWDMPEQVPVYVASKTVISEVVGFSFHRGVLALGKRKPCVALNDQFQSLKNVTRMVVCPEINDVENLGSIMRTSAGLGYQYVLLGPSCCDPFARRAIRTSMGTVFQLGIIQSTNLKQDMQILKQAFGFEWHGAVLSDRAVDLFEITPPSKVGLVLGSEANGLDQAWLDVMDVQVTIPMALHTDSLNVSVAAGIFMYHYRVQ